MKFESNAGKLPMKKVSTFLIFGLAGAISPALAAEPDLSKLPPVANHPGTTYAKDIRPILEASCFRCHGEQRPKHGLRLDSLEAVLRGSEDGKVIVPGKSAESALVLAVARLDEKTAMPPKPRQGRGGPGGPGGPGGGGPGGAGGPGGPGGPRTGGPNGAGGNAQNPNGGAPGQPGGPGRGPMGPPHKPLTPEQVSLIRAWVDQGAK